MSSHGSAPLATSVASGSNSGDDRHDPKGKRVEFCEKTGKSILDHSKMFLNILAKTIRHAIPASTPTWKDVKKEDIELILNRMEVKFDYPRSDVLFIDFIEQFMMAYLRHWRNMMRNHFTKMRGKRDMAFIKANPYKNIPFDQWNILCDHFGSQEFEGSSTMISQMKKKGNPETGELMSLIDYFKSRHLKPSDWAEMLTQTQSRTQSELGDSASSAEFVG
ncbi:hypothetical protein PanWU01x14_204280, partial [Parasponia andersonii]